MSEKKKFKFVNDYGDTIEAWMGEDGKVHFTHSDPDARPGEHTFTPSALQVCPDATDVVLSLEEIYFLLGVWLGKAEG